MEGLTSPHEPVLKDALILVVFSFSKRGSECLDIQDTCCCKEAGGLENVVTLTIA